VGIFDAVATVDQARAAFVLESWTNDRMELPARRLLAMPENDIVVGPGAHYAMAAFLHADAQGGRFNGPELGAWYASFDIDTAISETVHHNRRRLATSATGFRMTVQMRELVINLDADFHDLRGLRSSRPELYHPENYTDSQQFGEALRGADANGICFESVRRDDGTNIVVYRPRLVVGALQGDHYQYDWTGSADPTVTKLTNVPLP
jgi:RES domain-containing protein